MESFFHIDTDKSKAERYESFIETWKALIEGETDEISILANTAAALKEAFGFFWVGFYLVHTDEELHLGPFQGSVACYRIKKGRGVCGTAWEKGHSIVVPDVKLFPGHIACSSLSQSEIVVPLCHGKETKGVIDIDSDNLSAFDDTDRRYLEQIAHILTKSIYHA